jgi:sensor domain CHASE-containing protein
MMDWERLATLHVVKQHEVEINIERGELEIQTNIEIHLMEQLVVTMDTEPS